MKSIYYISVIVFYFFALKVYSASEDKAEALNYLSYYYKFVHFKSVYKVLWKKVKTRVTIVNIFM